MRSLRQVPFDWNAHPGGRLIRHGSIRQKIQTSPQKDQSRSVDSYRRGFRDQEMFGVGHFRRRRENQGRGLDVRRTRVSTQTFAHRPWQALQGFLAKRSRVRRRVLLTPIRARPATRRPACPPSGVQVNPAQFEQASTMLLYWTPWAMFAWLSGILVQVAQQGLFHSWYLQ